MPGRFYLTAIVILTIAALAGCGEALPEFGQVTGVVTVKGQPKKGLFVTFMPEPSEGKELSINAAGETDEQGKFELRYVFKGEEGVGAPVGPHRVLVHDPRFSSIPQGAPLPPRWFSIDYDNPSKTPLRFEVKPGPQTFEIKL
jgi:hypothetical protein